MCKIITAPTDIGEAQALALKGQLLDQRHYELLLDKTGIVETPDFEGVVCILLKNRLSKELLDKVRPILFRAASQPVAGGNRPDAAGAGKGLRRRADGSTLKSLRRPKIG